MNLIDLSHALSETTPVYPGTPPLGLEDLASIERDGFREKMLHLAGHIGTHVDAPAHILKDGRFINQMPVEAFYGQAQVLDVRRRDGQTRLTSDVLDGFHRRPKTQFILFQTGWSRNWGSDAYYHGYPYPDALLIRQLIDAGIHGFGIDAISIDAIDDAKLEAHHEILQANGIIIENLTRLHRLPDEPFTLACFPLNIREGDGSPVRAIAIVNEPEEI